MAIFGSGLSRACLFGSVLSSSLLLVACTSGTTPYCGGDAGCGYPLIEASTTDGSVLDGSDATSAADTGSADSGGDTGDDSDAADAASDDSASDAPSDDGSTDAPSVDAPVDSPTQG